MHGGKSTVHKQQGQAGEVSGVLFVLTTSENEDNYR